MSSPSPSGGSLGNSLSSSGLPEDLYRNSKFIYDEILRSSRGMTQGLGILEFLVYKRKKYLGILKFIFGILEFIFGILDLSLRILEFIFGILEFYLEILDLVLGILDLSLRILEFLRINSQNNFL